MGQPSPPLKSRLPSSVWSLPKKSLPLVVAAAGLAAVCWMARDVTDQAPSAAGHVRDAPRRADPVTEIGRVLRIPDLELRHRHEVALAAEVATTDIAAVLADLSPARRTSLYAVMLAGRWTAEDPAAASAWAAALTDVESRRLLLAVIAGSWADSDLASSVAWARLLADSSDREVALTGIARVAVALEPRQAMELAVEIRRPDLVHDCLRDWAQLEPEEAARWARRMTAGPERNAALLDVVTEWARRDPAGAADFAVQEMADEHLEPAVLGVIAQAGAADLPMLRDWVGSFPEGSLRHFARAELTRVERLLPSAPASLPGEDAEDRTPVAVAKP